MAGKEHLAELLTFFKALADETRLKIVGLLAQEAFSVEQLATILNLGSSTVSHHLGRLAGAGLVQRHSESYYRVYSLDYNRLREMSRRLLARETLPQAAEDLDINAYDAKVVRDFSRPDGSLKEIPARRKKLEAVLRHIVRDFEPGREYSEKQVNEIIERYHPDTATLRRELIGYRFMERAKGVYRRAADNPSAHER